MGEKQRKGRKPTITVRALDATAVRARRIITATLPEINVCKTIRTEIFPTAPHQVARLRQAVKETIPGHPALDAAVLLASELAANAIRHSNSEFFGLIIARTTDHGLRIAVIDEGRSGFPCLREKTTDAEGGRGLHLLDTMTERWGITRKPGTGLAIWFECASNRHPNPPTMRRS